MEHSRPIISQAALHRARCAVRFWGNGRGFPIGMEPGRREGRCCCPESPSTSMGTSQGQSWVFAASPNSQSFGTQIFHSFDVHPSLH